MSALTGEGLDALVSALRRHLPEGEDLFPGKTVTTADPRTRAAELIREKFLERTREEIPYGLGVLVEEWKRDEAKDLTVVKATVVVDRDGHKGIVLGAGGRLLQGSGHRGPPRARADARRAVLSRPRRGGPAGLARGPALPRDAHELSALTRAPRSP